MPLGGTLTLETSNARLEGTTGNGSAPDWVPTGSYVLLAVSDTGSGIPADLQGRIFEPFFTTKDVGRGSGLGLSMVYGFVKQSGGHISVDSAVGVGTTFKLYFPDLPAAAQHPVTAAGAAPPASDGAQAVTPGRVALVIEDEARLRKIAARLLRKAGFTVLEAENGLDALDLAAKADAIDLVFSDVELPGGLFGDEVAARLLRRFPAAKVLLTSGYPGGRNGGCGLLADAPLLSKPYAHAEVLAQLRMLFPPPA
jgi:CheY-like chemotaxis protein